MTMLAILFFALAVAGSIAEPQESLRGHRLISVQAKNREQVEFLASLEGSGLQLDFWSDPSIVRSTDIRVPPQQFGQVMQMLRSAGLQPEVVNSDIQALVEKEREEMARRPRNGPLPLHLSTYLDQLEIYSWIADYQDWFPYNMYVTSIGTTAEGRDILQVKIAEDFSSPKDAICVECLTHAREWITGSVCMDMIYNLLNNVEGGEDLLAMNDYIFFPVHNPDGYAYTHSNNRMWRKNREKNQDSDCVGTDLNRNWDASWGDTTNGASVSHDPCSDTYCGAEAFSAAETESVRKAVKSVQDSGINVKAFFSMHCYSNLILVPHGHTTAKPPDYDELMNVAYDAAAAIYNAHGQTFEVGTPPELLYRAPGGAYDYMKESLGIKWSYTFELRPYSYWGGGFSLPVNQIPHATYETWAAMRSFAYNIQ